MQIPLGIDITKEHISLVLINLYGNIVKHLKLEKDSIIKMIILYG